MNIMAPGPRPQPTQLKILRGNPRKEALNKGEPQPRVPPQVPEPPQFLNGYAREEWYRVGEELLRLRILTIVDIQPLAAYCQAYGRWRTAEEALARMAASDPITFGLLLKKGGNPVHNPLVAVAEKAAGAMVKYAAEFGLTPAARSRVHATDATAADSKFGPLLAG
jgi:P27 family predicted phage terminase small subunit